MRIISLIIVFLALAGIVWQVSAPVNAKDHGSASPTHAATGSDSTLKAMLADRVMGSESAPVTIIEYSSLTCPHCAEFNEKTLPLIKANYIDTGKVRWISRDFPLNGPALKAAQMARCAPPENYFPLIDLLFRGQTNWGSASDPDAAMAPLGRFAGLSDDDIKACLANTKLQDGIVAEEAEAQKKYNVDGTPTFIFNDGVKSFSGAETYEKFQSTIDSLLPGK